MMLNITNFSTNISQHPKIQLFAARRASCERRYACRIRENTALVQVFVTFFQFSVLTKIIGQPTSGSKAPCNSGEMAHSKNRLLGAKNHRLSFGWHLFRVGLGFDYFVAIGNLPRLSFNLCSEVHVCHLQPYHAQKDRQHSLHAKLCTEQRHEMITPLKSCIFCFGVGRLTCWYCHAVLTCKAEKNNLKLSPYVLHRHVAGDQQIMCF